MHKTSLCLLLALFGVPAIAQSSDVPPTHVMGETDDKNLKSCRVSYDPIIEAISAELKVIRVPPATLKQSIDGKALVMYVNANVLPLAVEGKSINTCSGYVSLQLYIPRVMVDPVSKVPRRTSLTYCNKGFNLTADRKKMQDQIIEKIRHLADECVNDYVQSEVEGK